MKRKEAIRMTAVTGNGKYGFLEIRRFYHKHAGIALFIAVLLHCVMIGMYYAYQALAPDEERIVTVRLLTYTDLGPPPSTTDVEATPQVEVSAPSVKPSIGVPVPVPDAEVNPEQTIPTQRELSAAPSPAVETGTGEGGQVVIENDLKIEDEDPPDFLPVEKLPVAIKQVTPEYPELARRANLEGTVIVKILVDKEGRAKKAVVIKSDAEVFNDAAVKAALQWVFTPAMMNNGPVAVWAAVPFKFRLNK